MKRPDFFIVGAPKGGTTAMNNYLRQHPQIFMSPRKEAHHFGADLYAPHWARDEAAYLALFAGAGDEKRIGEASVWYLLSQHAAGEKDREPSGPASLRGAARSTGRPSRSPRSSCPA